MSAKIFQLHKRSVYVFDAIQDKYSFDPSQTFLLFLMEPLKDTNLRFGQSHW